MNPTDHSTVHATTAGLSIASFLTTINPAFDLQPVIVAGDPTGNPPDSPDDRIDPNIPTSPFAGVGSISVSVAGVGDFLGSGTPISRRHVLTAAHVLDVVNDDGIIDPLPQEVLFNLNVDGILSDRISASNLYLFPGFQGFNSSLENDLAIIELSEDLPADVPIYSLYRQPLTDAVITMVGYGTSGTGVEGFELGTASFDQKRVGQNQVDLELQGIFLFDFDGADASTNLFTFFGSDGTLGNDLEATLGPGDSGGPSFVQQGNRLLLAGVNTFAFGIPDGFGLPGAVQGAFGTGAGGVVVSDPAKLAWLDGFINSTLPTLSIGDALAIEGDSGTTELQFTLSLSFATASIVTATYTTSDGTAIAPTDYTATTGTVTFNPGQTSTTLTISLVGDVEFEPDETFLLNLTNPTNATIADAGAIATISNNDPLPSGNPPFVGTPNNDTLVGTDAADQISGGGGNDRLSGGGGADQLEGNLGNDVLLGGDGSDYLIGGGGNDRLIGGQENDQLSGGGGRDRFIYQAIDERVDRITDFNVRLDTIDVSAILNNSAYRADDLFASYLRVSQSGANTIVRIDANGDSRGGLTRLVILQNFSGNLSAQNFVVE